MRLLAAFFDIADDGLDLGDIALLLGILGGIPAAIVYAIVRWNAKRSEKIHAAEREQMTKQITETVTKQITDTVVERTVQIQKGANGRRSLGDLADRVGNVEASMSDVRGTVAGLDGRLDVIEGLLRAIVGGSLRTDP